MKISRRKMIQISAGTGFALSLSSLPSVLGQTPELNTTTIPSSGQQVPSIGIGARNYRAQGNSAELPVFTETLQTFHSLGGRVIDTSPNYGNSEEVVGNIMRQLSIRDEMWVATKVDRQGKAEGIERMERSFELLGGDHFELMQVHNLRGTSTQLETMAAWKEQGRFRYIGVTTSSDRQYSNMEQVIQNNQLDFIQIDYSLGNRNAADRILPMARDKGLAVLVNLPFGRGRLFQAVGDRPLPDWANDIDANSWAQVFLKYVMSNGAATIPIPGTTKPHHAVDNIASARGRLPDENLRREMEAFIDPLLA